MRGLFKGLLVDQFGVDRRALDTVVFPGSAAVAPTPDLVVYRAPGRDAEAILGVWAY